MTIDTPRPRNEYKPHLDSLEHDCSFCAEDKKDGLVLGESQNFVWAYAAFPYQKFHTVVRPKRHVTNASELSPHELKELMELIDHADARYRSAGIVGDDGIGGDQCYVSWRTRSKQEAEGKKKVAHFHVHIYPRHSQGADIELDPDAHKFDTNLLLPSLT